MKKTTQFQKPHGMIGRFYLKNMNRVHMKFAEWCIRQAEIQNGMTVLDLGCGGGAVIRKLLRDYPASKVCGLDYSPTCVSYAGKINRPWADRCRILRGRAEKNPFPDEKFDLVTAFETIYFWENPMQGILEAKRVLKPGGRLLICCDMDDTAESRKLAAGVSGMRLYSPDLVRSWMQDAGFRNVCAEKGDREWFYVSGEKRAAEDPIGYFPKGKRDYSFEEVCRIVSFLRSPGGCPWDRSQTHESMTGCLIEECQEVLDAIEKKDDRNLCEELGDVLFQVLMHSRIAEEEGTFTVEEVLSMLGRKMVRRHPHVFEGEIYETEEARRKRWQEIKQRERDARKRGIQL